MNFVEKNQERLEERERVCNCALSINIIRTFELFDSIILVDILLSEKTNAYNPNYLVSTSFYLHFDLFSPKHKTHPTTFSHLRTKFPSFLQPKHLHLSSPSSLPTRLP